MLHDEAITNDRWVIEGNYTRGMPQRLQRATGLVLLDISTGESLLRYFRRTWFERGRRAEAFEGGRDSIRWDMVRHIAVTQREGRRRYSELFQTQTLPKIALTSRRAILAFYAAEGLPWGVGPTG